jgi:hypothetical protein
MLNIKKRAAMAVVGAGLAFALRQLRLAEDTATVVTGMRRLTAIMDAARTACIALKGLTRTTPVTPLMVTLGIGNSHRSPPPPGIHCATA